MITGIANAHLRIPLAEKKLLINLHMLTNQSMNSIEKCYDYIYIRSSPLPHKSKFIATEIQIFTLSSVFVCDNTTN